MALYAYRTVSEGQGIRIIYNVSARGLRHELSPLYGHTEVEITHSGISSRMNRQQHLGLRFTGDSVATPEQIKERLNNILQSDRFAKSRAMIGQVIDDIPDQLTLNRLCNEAWAEARVIRNKK